MNVSVVADVDIQSVLNAMGDEDIVSEVSHQMQYRADDAVIHLITELIMEMQCAGVEFLADDVERRIRAHMKWEKENGKRR